MRIAVATEKPLQPDHIGGVGAADQHRPTDAFSNQADPPQDERAHDAFAEFRFRHQQGSNPRGRDQQRLDFPFRDAVDQCGAVRKLSDFSQELARALLRHWRYVAHAVALGYGDVAGEHDVHTWTGFAGFDQFFAVGVAMQRAEAAQPIDLLAVRIGKVSS